jgi:hypothetical protein
VATVKAALTPQALAGRILVIRGQRVMLDSDLAELYEVETKRFNEQVKRNAKRFPADFMFRLTAEEFDNLRSQFATSSWGGRRYPPLVFTEHGAIRALMAQPPTAKRPIGFTADLSGASRPPRSSRVAKD